MDAEPATTANASELEELDYRRALDLTVRALGRREHTRRELTRKLSSKRFAPGIIERVLDYLTLHDLVSDLRFADTFVRSRISRGYGPVYLRHELSQRGVSEAEIQSVLSEAVSSESTKDGWLEVAEQALARKYPEPPADSAAWNSRARFLARRGFPSPLIYRILGEQRP